MSIRRVVTGLSPDGKSVFVSDDVVDPWEPPVLRGNQNFVFWGSDDVPLVPNDGAQPTHEGFLPPPRGYRFLVFRVPPTSFEPPPIEDVEAAAAASESMMPGLTTQIADPGGMHETQTVDLEMVTEGRIWLILDSGEEKEIRAGEVIVQNGTAHRWENRHPTEWATLCLIFVGARRAAFKHARDEAFEQPWLAPGKSGDAEQR